MAIEINRGLILFHALHPCNQGILDQPDFIVLANNPLSGDEPVLNLRLEAERIPECNTYLGECSICHASNSMMSEKLEEKSIAEASSLSKKFQFFLKPSERETPRDLESLHPFMILKAHRSHIKYVNLTWNALTEWKAGNRHSYTKPPTLS